MTRSHQPKNSPQNRREQRAKQEAIGSKLRWAYDGLLEDRTPDEFFGLLQRADTESKHGEKRND